VVRLVAVTALIAVRACCASAKPLLVGSSARLLVELSVQLVCLDSMLEATVGGSEMPASLGGLNELMKAGFSHVDSRCLFTPLPAPLIAEQHVH
jgi:hypothetical protein